MESSPESKKKNILISLDEELFIEGKKILYKKNLSPQQLMVYIFHQATLGDENVLSIIDRASKDNAVKITEEERKKIKVINNDILYDLIEQQAKRQGQ